VHVAEFSTPEQADVYRWRHKIKAENESQPLRHLWTIVDRTWQFFLREWLCLPALVGLLMWRDAVMTASVALLAGALFTSSLYPSFFPHYWAAYGGVLFLLAVRGLMRFPQWRPFGKPLGTALASFFVAGAFATVVRAVPLGPILGISDYGYVPPLRGQVADRLNAAEGRHVVFVKYGPTHSFHDEWVYNAADIDAARIVWCRAIGPEEDARVIRYYDGRSFWLADVEARMARVTRLAPGGRSPSPADSVQPTEEWLFRR
jgi:hypothetical protein